MSTLAPLDAGLAEFLVPYLPAGGRHRTLTYAASLDSRISASRTEQTALSGPETKTMTHFLRSRHDAILVGSGTAVCDDPGLNCRLPDASGVLRSPRPVVVDTNFSWDVQQHSRAVRTARDGAGLGPWVLVRADAADGAATVGGAAEYARKRAVLEAVGGAVLPVLPVADGAAVYGRARWDAVFGALEARGVESLMIEGGARVINDLLALGPAAVDSVVVTVAPLFLGARGVEVSPLDGRHDMDAVRWQPVGRDVVLGGVLRA
ncbi:Rib7p [Dipodascopsis tothii]|uniref:Rib7p n=1 Tax=Dipodascopsis tothii TaxID=44089 RepID=UPI0034CDECEE